MTNKTDKLEQTKQLQLDLATILVTHLIQIHDVFVFNPNTSSLDRVVSVGINQDSIQLNIELVDQDD